MAANEEIGNHPVSDPAVDADQLGGSAYADAERPIDVVGLDDPLVLIRDKLKAQVVGVGEPLMAAGRGSENILQKGRYLNNISTGCICNRMIWLPALVVVFIWLI